LQIWVEKGPPSELTYRLPNLATFHWAFRILRQQRQEIQCLVIIGKSSIHTIPMDEIQN
jgi:hypothetical protein